MEKQENKQRGNLSSRLSNGAKRFGNSTKDGAKRFGKYALIGTGISGLVAGGVIITLAATGYFKGTEQLDKLPIENNTQLVEAIEVSKERSPEQQLNTYRSLIDGQTLKYLSGELNKDLYQKSIEGIYNQFRFENGVDGPLNEEFAGWDYHETFEGIKVYHNENDGTVNIIYQGEDSGIEVVSGSTCDYLAQIFNGELPDESPLTEDEIFVYNSPECSDRRAEKGN